jgi:CheY-like chemotaxis protein
MNSPSHALAPARSSHDELDPFRSTMVPQAETSRGDARADDEPGSEPSARGERANDAAPNDATAHHVPPREDAGSETSELCIVLAEDNPGDVYLIREALAIGGRPFALRVLEDGESAREYFLALHARGHALPDLILLDLNLPRIDGRSVLRGVRSSSRLAHVPVVVLTSSESPRDQSEVLELGADAFLQKPSNLDDLLLLGPKLVQLSRR